MTSLIPMDVAPVFVDTALRAVLLLGLAGLVTLALWRASAATRHLVWTFALVGVLAVPALRLTLPPVELPLPVALTSDVVPRTAGVSDEPAGGRDPGSAAANGVGDIDAPARLVAGSTDAYASATTAASRATSPAPFATPRQDAPAGEASLPALPLVIWLLGVCVFLLPLAAGWIGLHRLARRAHRLEDPRIRHRATRLAARLGLKRSYRLLESPSSMPMTFGLVRATIVLPSDAAEWSTSTLDAVLLHELAHVARRDTATQLLAELVRALHWFNPLAWLAARRLRVERERACDDMALAAGSRPSEYADELLKLVRSYRRSPAPVAALAMARRGEVSRRLRAVLDESRRRNRVGGLPAVGSALVALVVVLACTAAAPVPAGSSTPADPPVPRGDLDLVGANHPLGAGEIVGEIAFVGDIKLGGDVDLVGGVVAVDAGAKDASGQAVTCIAEAGDWNTMQIQSRNGDKHIRMRRQGCDFELRMEGDVQFDAHEMTIRGMASNARLRIEEDSRGTDHSLDIRVGRDGAPVYAYERDGRDHEFDSGARAWFAATLHSLFRETGFMADARVEALLRVGGVEAVLRELGQVQRSHVFASYTRSLLEQATLDEAQLRAVVRSSARRVESDHYMARILEAVAAHQQLGGGLLDDYLIATSALDSDHYRSETLRAAIHSDRLTGPQIEQVLRAAGTMDSDHYRSGILAGIADRYALEPGFRTAYLEATASMDSDHYRSQVLGRLLERGDLSPDDKAGVLRATAMVDSDHYRSQLLRQVAGRGIREPGLQRAFFDVAAGLGSDHYYRQSLTALLEQGVDAELLVRVLDSAATEMDSDHYLSELLLSVLNDYTVQGAVRDAFLRAMDSMDSTHYRSRVADALLRSER